MNFAEIKEKVAALSAKERREMAAFLTELADEDAFREAVSKRMKAMDEGEKVTQKQFEAQVRKMRPQKRKKISA